MGRSTRNSGKVKASEPAVSSGPRQSSRSRSRRATRSTTRSATRSVTRSITRSATRSARNSVEPAAKPIAEPVIEPATKPVTEPATELAMAEEEDDDMYGSGETAGQEGPSIAEAEAPTQRAPTNSAQIVKEDEEEEEEEDDDEEEEEDDSDDDIEIITVRKPETPADHHHQQKPPSAAVKIEPPRAGTPATIPQIGTPGQAQGTAAAPIGRISSPAPGRPGSSYPEVKTSTLDLDGNPVLNATGKPILNTDMDADFTADTAPWRRPGSDMTDYYNFGFDEGTWAAYCIKQRQNRGEVAEDRKRMEQLGAMMGGGGMPFGGMMPGMDPAAAGGISMPSMEQMQQMMSMMGGGMPGMPGMPGMDINMGQAQNNGYQNQGGYGGGRNQGGRGKRW